MTFSALGLKICPVSRVYQIRHASSLLGAGGGGGLSDKTWTALNRNMFKSWKIRPTIENSDPSSPNHDYMRVITSLNHSGWEWDVFLNIKIYNC